MAPTDYRHKWLERLAVSGTPQENCVLKPNSGTDPGRTVFRCFLQPPSFSETKRNRSKAAATPKLALLSGGDIRALRPEGNDGPASLHKLREWMEVADFVPIHELKEMVGIAEVARGINHALEGTLEC
ncbi:hypothetical protein NDU88_001276 [Pleurodeles waltl]|uniref:Uncharacterized protein n=1 Tax=Pleurodeles waltl TaxID=8319 RepID=A0AAV7WKE0_PLEWA|nr:hypothetical protein NDU88_001276 [Pleurodeles waltl]